MAYLRDVRPFRNELPDEAISTLVCSAFSWMAWARKIDTFRNRVCQPWVLRKLFAIVESHCSTQCLREIKQLLSHLSNARFGLQARNFVELQEPAASIRAAHQTTSLAGTDDCVTLPVTTPASSLCCCRAASDRNRRRQMPTPIVLGPSFASSMKKSSPMFSIRIFSNPPFYRAARYPFLGIQRVLSHPTGHLFRGPIPCYASTYSFIDFGNIHIPCQRSIGSTFLSEELDFHS